MWGMDKVGRAECRGENVGSRHEDTSNTGTILGEWEGVEINELEMSEEDSE